MKRAGPHRPVAKRTGVVRLGLSIEPDLLVSLDRWVAGRNSRSRSDAIRFLVRKELGEMVVEDPQADVVGTVTVLYRHDDPNVQRRVTSAAHRWGAHVRSSTHIHLKGEACVEVVTLTGQRREVEEASEDLRGVKGIIQGRYVLIVPGLAGGTTGHRHPHERSRGPRSIV